MIHNNPGPGEKMPSLDFENSAYYNQFFKQKLTDEKINKWQYYPQDHRGKW